MKGVLEKQEPKGFIAVNSDGTKAFFPFARAPKGHVLEVGQEFEYELETDVRFALQAVKDPKYLGVKKNDIPEPIAFNISAVDRPEENGWFLITVKCRAGDNKPCGGFVQLFCRREFKVFHFGMADAITGNPIILTVGQNGVAQFYITFEAVGYVSFTATLLGNSDCPNQELGLFRG